MHDANDIADDHRDADASFRRRAAMRMRGERESVSVHVCGATRLIAVRPRPMTASGESTKFPENAAIRTFNIVSGDGVYDRTCSRRWFSMFHPTLDHPRRRVN
jgi:hypothetical protein